MEICYSCGDSQIVEVDDGYTCSSCARSQNTLLLRGEYKTDSSIWEAELSCPILAELAHRLGLTRDCTSSISDRMKLLWNRRSNYSTVQLITALHYIHEMEDNMYVSPFTYTLLYNGCTDCKTLDRCVKYIMNTLNIEPPQQVSSWIPFIEPYVDHFLFRRKDIENVIDYCDKLYSCTCLSIYSIPIVSIMVHCVICEIESLESIISKAQEKCSITSGRLKKMYLNARKFI